MHSAQIFSIIVFGYFLDLMKMNARMSCQDAFFPRCVMLISLTFTNIRFGAVGHHQLADNLSN